MANLLKILADQKQTINKIKDEVRTRQKTLDNVYNHAEVVDRENELKDLKRQLALIMEEKHSLVEVAKKQEEELRQGALDNAAKKEINELAVELGRRKEEHRRLQEENKLLDKQVSENHNIIIVLSKKYQESKKRAKLMKPAYLKESKNPTATADITELEAEYSALLAKREEVNKTFEQEKRDYEYLYKKLKADTIATGKLLAEKNKEVILNSIKLKKLKRETPEEYAKDLQREKALAKSKEKYLK